MIGQPPVSIDTLCLPWPPVMKWPARQKSSWQYQYRTPSGEMLGETSIQVRQSASQPLAELARRRSSLDIAQITHQFVARLGRSVQHEVDPGPGLSVFTLPHILQAPYVFQFL
jgi:hypothetical protein